MLQIIIEFSRYYVTLLFGAAVAVSFAGMPRTRRNRSAQIPESSKRIIQVRLFSRNNKLCIDIRNRYHTEPLFHHGLPVSQEQGYGPHHRKAWGHIPVFCQGRVVYLSGHRMIWRLIFAFCFINNSQRGVILYL